MTPDEKREKVVAYLLHLAHLIESSDPESVSGMISLEVVSADRSCASLVIHQPSRERRASMDLAFKVDMDLEDDGEHLEDVEPHPTGSGGDVVMSVHGGGGCGGNAHVSGSPLKRPDLIGMGGLSNAHMNEMEDAKWLDFGVSSGGGRHIEIEPLHSIVMLTPTDLIDMWQAMGLSKKAAMSLWPPTTPDHVQDPPVSGLTPGGRCTAHVPGHGPGGRVKV